MTPEQARTALVQGNLRFVEGRPEHPRAGADRRRETVEQGQHPLAVVVGCSDSRAPLELLFDQGVGDLFVVRSAGHVLDAIGLASVEYAVDHLEAPLVVVLGHSRCGAITAAVQGGAAHGHLPELLGRLSPAVLQARTQDPGAEGEALVVRAIQAQVELTARQVQDDCELVRKAVRSGACRVVGAIYDLASGRVAWLQAR
ncbi:MAG TPA: carbonic anhydrase [Myxococcota bacterium]|nr:carbonic anhydrase [Myxococcota bacterium]HRY95538.1 carbonic anhydrase [Myxococcota bacterium]HSA19940.1 carbonic anhydrase [Myxococcota bacterium]